METPSCLQFSAPLRFALVRNERMASASPVACGVDCLRTVVCDPVPCSNLYSNIVCGYCAWGGSQHRIGGNPAPLGPQEAAA